MFLTSPYIEQAISLKTPAHGDDECNGDIFSPSTASYPNHPVLPVTVVWGAALATAGIECFRRRLWGWRLAVVIIAAQLLGDLVNCVRGDWVRGGAGIIIAGALLLFLLQPRIRATFA